MARRGSNPNGAAKKQGCASVPSCAVPRCKLTCVVGRLAELVSPRQSYQVVLLLGALAISTDPSCWRAGLRWGCQARPPCRTSQSNTARMNESISRARRGRMAQRRRPANVPVPPASRVEQVVERGSALRDVLLCCWVTYRLQLLVWARQMSLEPWTPAATLTGRNRRSVRGDALVARREQCSAGNDGVRCDAMRQR